MNYDALLKSVLTGVSARFLTMLVGSKAVAQLSVEFNSVDRRVPDLVVQLADGRILHLELQVKNDRTMARRMLQYRLLLRGRYEEPPLEQIVLYVGNPPLSMPDEIDERPQLHYRFGLHDMREFDGRDILLSADPAERVLALLCGSPDPSETLREVLRSWSGLSGKELASLWEKLIIVVGLRRLETVLKREVAHMPIEEDVLLENKILQEWREQALQRGLKQGLRQGQDEGIRRTLLRLLERRFGSVPDWAEQRVLTAPREQAEEWALRVLDAASMEEVLS